MSHLHCSLPPTQPQLSPLQRIAVLEEQVELLRRALALQSIAAQPSIDWLDSGFLAARNLDFRYTGK